MASDRDPFFVVYRRRSGSTFLSNLLCGSAAIGIAPESRFLERLWRWSKGAPIRSEAELAHALDTCIYHEPRFAAWGIGRDEAWAQLAPRLPITISDLARWFIDAYCDRTFPESTIRGMKKGGWYATHIDVLRKLFPEARFVMLLRDGRAVFASCKQARYGSSGKVFETRPANEAYAWRQVVKSFEQQQGRDRTILIRYEDLVSDPRRSLKPLLTFLRAPTDDASLDAMLRPGSRFQFDSSSAHLHVNVDQAPLRERIDAWRTELAPLEVEEFELVAGGALARHGYPPVFERLTRTRLRRIPALLGNLLTRARSKLKTTMKRP